MTLPRFEIKKDIAEEFRFNLHAKSNGETILRSSEGYTSKQNCIKGIESVKVNASIDSRYNRFSSSDAQYMFIS
jgi:uncharacterized protein YegP (UPF0339 family)